MTNARAYRPLLARAAIAALTAACVVAAAAPARATPSIVEAILYAEGELNRLCNSHRNSRFSELTEGAALSGCRFDVRDGSITLDVRFRIDRHRSDQSQLGIIGELEKRMVFDKTSRFFCSSFGDDGMAQLYLSCHRDQVDSGYDCAERRIEILRNGQTQRAQELIRSFADIVAVPEQSCRNLSRSLNFIAQRSNSARAQDRVADFFEN